MFIGIFFLLLFHDLKKKVFIGDHFNHLLYKIMFTLFVNIFKIQKYQILLLLILYKNYYKIKQYFIGKIA